MSGRRNRGGGGGGHGGGGEERWLLPYADMITLLLGLFIVLFAMSSIDAKQFDNVKRSLAETFKGSVFEESGGAMPGANGALDPNASTAAPATTAMQVNQAARQTAARFQQQEQQLKGLVKQSGLGNDVKVVTNERGIQINLAGDALFDSGSWEIKPSFREKLVRIERQLEEFGHPIEIAGHTDGVPFPGGNRLLGWNRAHAVFQLFVQQEYPSDRIEIVSWGDDRPVTKPQNPTTPNPKNRRIEITVLQPAADVAMTDIERTAALAEHAAAAPGAKPAAPKPVEAELAKEFEGSTLITELATTSKAAG